VLNLSCQPLDHILYILDFEVGMMGISMHPSMSYLNYVCISYKGIRVLW
jgi:hypothetical protein